MNKICKAKKQPQLKVAGNLMSQNDSNLIDFIQDYAVLPLLRKKLISLFVNLFCKLESGPLQVRNLQESLSIFSSKLPTVIFPRNPHILYPYNCSEFIIFII